MRPAPPQWLVELGIGAGRPPVRVHAGTCHMAGKRRQAVSQEEARRLLASGLRACTHCEPDVQLRIIDLSAADPTARHAVNLGRRVTVAKELGEARIDLHGEVTAASGEPALDLCGERPCSGAQFHDDGFPAFRDGARDGAGQMPGTGRDGTDV